MVLKRTLVCSLAFVFALSGCTTKVIPVYQAKSVSAYKLNSTKNGLSIAVHPITDPKESEEYFGIDLIKSKILAVMVKAENAVGSSSKTLSPENFSFDRKHIGQSSTKASDEFGESLVGEGVGLAGVASLMIIPIVSLPLVFVGMKMTSDATEVRHNLERKAFRSKTLSAGKQTNGFMYFKLPEKELGPDEMWVIRINARDMKNKETINFEFNMDLGEIKR